MPDFTREEIDRELSRNPRYQESPPERQAVWRKNAYDSAGIGREEQRAPKAGLSSQAAMTLEELSPGVVRPSPKLHPIFGAIERLSPGTGGELQGIFNREAIPTLMTAAGGPLGTGARLGAMGKAMLEAGLSGAGRGINQATGIEPPSTTNLGASLVVPPLARGAAAALQNAPRMLPGASAALQEEGAAAARGYASKNIIPGAQPASALYQEVEKLGNPTVPTANLQQAMTDLSKKEGKVIGTLQNKAIADTVDGFQELIDANPQGVPFDQVRANLQRLNERVRATRAAGDETYGAMKKLQQAVQADLDAVPGSHPAVVKLREANKTYRREIARDELQSAIETKGVTRQGEFIETVNPNAIKNWINKTADGQHVREALTKDELAQLDTTLQEWAKIPTAPVKRGAPIGSGRRLGIIGAGGAVGGATSGGLGAAVGMLAADKGSELISRALMSETGRTTLMKVLRANGGQFGQREAAIMSAALAGELGNAIEP